MADPATGRGLQPHETHGQPGSRRSGLHNFFQRRSIADQQVRPFELKQLPLLEIRK
jgi:hypothetical protein